jgi:hypothetical protein
MEDDPIHRSQDEDDRPWEQPGAVRRDCASHRGGLLLILGMIGVWCGFVSICIGFAAIPGLGIAVVAWALARHDLILMRTGRMDRDGMMKTRTALERGAGGALLNSVTLLLWGLLFLMAYYVRHGPTAH